MLPSLKLKSIRLGIIIDGRDAKTNFNLRALTILDDQAAKLDLFFKHDIPERLVRGGNPPSPAYLPTELLIAVETPFDAFTPVSRLGNLDALIEDLRR